jgi:hypothetical protein
MKWILDLEEEYPDAIRKFYEWQSKECIVKFNDSKLFDFFWCFGINPFAFIDYDRILYEKPHDTMRIILILSFETLQEALNGKV